MKNNTPSRNMDCLDMAVEAWRQVAPTIKFSGITLAEFEAKVVACRLVRDARIEIDNNRKQNIVQRDADDTVALSMREMIVFAILGDPNFGPNSALYEMFGYKRKDDYKSGLTRKKKNPPLDEEGADE